MDGDADAKEDKKEPFLEVFELVVVLIILGAILLRAVHYFSSGSFGTWLSLRPNITLYWNDTRVWFSEIILSLTAFSNGFCLLLAAFIGYVIFRQGEVNKAWHKKLYPPEQDSAAVSVKTGVDFFGGARGAPPPNLPGAEAAPVRFEESNGRWQNVVAHISSDSPANWRLAILEADIVLAEVLDRAGYIGETIGDKLKNAERRPFAGLNAAWEAHKVRNLIAHEGQNFELTQREARRVINLYQAAIADILRISR
jgi:hypothetical protein